MSSSFIGAPSAAQTSQLASGILQLGLGELAQHTARVTGATNENMAANQIVPAFDADIAAIVAGYESGGYTATQCIAALAAVDAQCKTYLMKQVGKPGTAWNGACSGPVCACDKACTVGCCIYYNDLHAAMVGGASGVPAGGLVGLFQAGSGTCWIPEVYGDSYGLNERAGYYVTLTAPTKSVTGQVNSTVNNLLGTTSTPPAAGTVAPSSGILGTLTNSTLVTIVGVVGGILIIVAYLFGSNAVRVNR